MFVVCGSSVLDLLFLVSYRLIFVFFHELWESHDSWYGQFTRSRQVKDLIAGNSQLDANGVYDITDN